jgi:hypothetical protein
VVAKNRRAQDEGEFVDEGLTGEVSKKVREEGKRCGSLTAKIW